MNDIENFINNSLSNSAFNNTFELELNKNICNKIQVLIGLNVYKYDFIIEAQYIRHIKNNHEEDLYLLPKIQEILNSCDKVEKSITRNTQTGKTDISIVFEKRLDDGTVKMVALRVIKHKILSLKTFFRK